MPRFIPSARSARFFADDHFLLGRFEKGVSFLYNDQYSNDCEDVIDQLYIDQLYKNDGDIELQDGRIEGKFEVMGSVRLAHKYKQVTALQANVRRRQAHMRLIRAYFGHS